MKVTRLFFFMIVIGCVSNTAHSSACENLLPVYPPRMQIVSEAGVPLISRSQPVLELKEICLNINTKYLVPKTIRDADAMLRQYLSDDLYLRLLNGYKKIHTGKISEQDMALNERLGDLAIFFNEAWDLKVNVHLVKESSKRKDYYERFEGLLDAVSELNKKGK